MDDGKSTLIGRLLHDTRQIQDDQLAAVESASRRRGAAELDLSLLTDGLEAEREQGITIDVAYRYFATPRRKFIVADTPGHEQYTRNMATGASTADAAVVLADARKGLVAQGKRHLYLARLLGIANVVVAVNKMDLVGYSREAFDAVKSAFERFAAPLGALKLQLIPVSALRGDMIAQRGEALAWYEGPTLLEALEAIEPARASLERPLRFPVQLVQRTGEGRAYLGRVASGSVAAGDAVLALPAERRTTIVSLRGPEGERGRAVAGDSVALALADDIDLARGDLLADPRRAPRAAKSFAATLVWLGGEPLAPGRRYALKHTTRTVKARVVAVESRLDVETLEKVTVAQRVAMNDIVDVSLVTQQPLFAEPYEQDRATGAFILIDEHSNHTVAAGLIRQRL